MVKSPIGETIFIFAVDVVSALWIRRGVIYASPDYHMRTGEGKSVIWNDWVSQEFHRVGVK